MKKKLLMLALATVTGYAHAQKQKTTPTAQQVVQQAIAAMGGEAALKSISSLSYHGIGHRYWTEQSERPEGPWIVSYVQVDELRDVAQKRLLRKTQSKFTQSPEWSPVTMKISEGAAAQEMGPRVAPGKPNQLREAEETFALAPERLLLTALLAKDLKLEKQVIYQNVPQQVLSFTWNGNPVRLLLNAHTHLPTALDLTDSYPDDLFIGRWGDVTTRTIYSYWTLETGGIRYPRQRNVERNQQPYEEFTILDLKLNPAAPADTFAIPEATRQAFLKQPARNIDSLPLGLPNKPADTLAVGVVKIPGMWDVAIVQQPDGLLILEAPISSGYSSKVIAEANRRFPNQKIKGVITTSDAWPHFAGIREYAALGIPIIALDLNKPILERYLKAPHTQHPDLLQTKPRKADITLVSGKTVIGTGPNRLELYPVRGEGGERMMMVYFPEHQLLYGSDLAQRMPDKSFFMPQYVSELTQAVQRENLKVKKVFAMHLEETDWAELEAAVQKAAQPLSLKK
ncbi:MBL fold metallo-hydrolase [Sabulibacter ruber]|uniref:MBL fold metallo-hydrolase n=1 Tax=Sabulibacter ruber TaxID=2811901 RepID=UPI001A962879|nr:MBL fold metallo-hydrolase [Sabulibacter ruber]